jgi:hypothetical protein
MVVNLTLDKDVCCRWLTGRTTNHDNQLRITYIASSDYKLPTFVPSFMNAGVDLCSLI